MIDLEIPSLTRYARLAFDAYYRDESLSDYIDDAGGLTIDDLDATIYDDIRDLLHNSNQEDLWPTLDADECDELAHALHDGWSHDPDHLEILTTMIANAMKLNALMKQYNITTRDELNALTETDTDTPLITDLFALGLPENDLQAALTTIFND